MTELLELLARVAIGIWIIPLQQHVDMWPSETFTCSGILSTLTSTVIKANAARIASALNNIPPVGLQD